MEGYCEPNQTTSTGVYEVVLLWHTRYEVVLLHTLYEVVLWHTLYEVPVFDCLAVQDCVLAANKDVSWLLTINILPIKDEE